MQTSSSPAIRTVLVSCLAAATLAQAGVAAAQPAPPPIAPPAGEYAPPPSGAEAPGSVYDEQAQAYDRDYAERYSQWAAQYCVAHEQQRQKNATTGAVVGGVLGAIVGSNVAGHHQRTEGAIAGGALGALAGAAIGSSSTSNSDACPPGYGLRGAAPAFYYPPTPYGAAVIVGPAWYRPWAWGGDRWVYRPYRYWYWENRTYWRPDYRPGEWHYNYHRW